MSRLPGVIAFAAIAAITVVPAHAGMVDKIIFGKCSSAMRKEYEKAGKQLLLSHMKAICNGGRKEMKNKQRVEQAKTFCTS